MHLLRKLLLATSALLPALASCAETPLPRVASLTVDLPGAAPTVVTVQPLTYPDTVSAPRPLRGGRVANAELGGGEPDWLVLRALDGLPTGMPDAKGVPIPTRDAWRDETSLRGKLLFDSRSLDRDLRLTPLSDFASRRLAEYAGSLPIVRFQVLKDRVAEALLAVDLDGDDDVGYTDLLTFDPRRADHLAALRFDWNEATSTRLASCDCTIAEAYGREPALLEERLDEAFGRYVDIEWPGDGHDRVSSVTIDVDPGGAVTVDELPDVKLDATTNRRFVYRTDRAPLDLPALTLRATPGTDYRFAGWSGCDAVLPDGACRMVPDDQERTVSPLFDFEDVLRTDVDVLKLADLPDTRIVGDAGEGGLLVLEAPAGGPGDTRLAALAEGAVLIVAQPRLGTARVDRAAERTTNGDLARFTFAVTETSPLAAFQHMTAFDVERPTTIDDVTVVEVGDVPAPTPAQPLRSGKAHALTKHRAALVYFQGLGKAFDLGQGLFLTQLPGSSRMVVVSAHGDALALDAAKLDAKAYERCTERPGLPGCAEVRPDIFTPTPCKILEGKNCILPTLVVTKKVGKFTLTFSIEGAVDATVGGNVSFAFPAYMELNTRGDLTYTLAAELFAGLAGSTEAYKTCRKAVNAKEVAPLPKPSERATDPNVAFDDSLWEAPPAQLLKACDRERPGLSEDAQAKREAERQVLREVTLQINKASPEGAAFPVSVGFKIGVEARGRLGARVVAVFRPRVRWDYSMQFGLKCSWSSILPSCDGFSNFSGNQKFTSSYKVEAGITANATIEPYAAVGVYAGVRGVQEDIFAIEARVGLPWKLVGTGPSLRYSTLREDVNVGQGGWCFSGNFGLATGLSADFSVGAKLQLSVNKDVGIGKVEWNKSWTLFGYSHTEPLVEDFVLVKDVGAGATCAPPGTIDADNLPAEIEFQPGHDWADPPNSRQTKTHELVLQDDGNFVLYRINERDAKGLPKKKTPTWATNQNGKATYVLFQEDGNLVQYDIRRNALWSTGTHGAKDTKLTLQSNGDLVLRGSKNGTNGVLWSSKTGGK